MCRSKGKEQILGKVECVEEIKNDGIKVDNGIYSLKPYL